MPSGILDRDERRAWLDEQTKERKKQREREQELQLAAFELENQKLWAPFAHQAKTSGELNIAWKQARGFFTWERVLPFRDLLALRITGHDLGELPEALPLALPSLETLSFIDDGLEKLPESIGTLRYLMELDLTKNRLRELPDTLTKLTALKILNLSCNVLEKLPEEFGKLEKLEKIWLENNKLTQLPASIGGCRSARCANFNCNKLSELPESIGALTALTALSVNMNELIELPDTIVALPNLQSLHASRNQLIKLPRCIGDMQALRELRLDWNSIQELPFSFRALTNLQFLCMEQNLLRLPTIDVIARGVPETLSYMDKALVEFQRSSRREVVEALLDSNCDHLAPPNCELKLYGVVWDNFYSDLLPAIERAPMPFSQRFSPEEIEDALMNYDDKFGVVSVAGGGDIPGVLVEFRQCACLDPVALRERNQQVRKACLPRAEPYRCQRMGRLLRAQMLTKDQAQDQLASLYLRAKVARLELKTRRRAIEYINSTLGVVHFERTARVLAHEMLQRRRRLRKLYRKHEKAQRQLDSRRDKLRRKVEAFQRAKDVRLESSKDKYSRLEKDRETVKHELERAIAKDKGGALAAAKTKKLGKVDEKMSKLKAELEESGPENAKIYDIERAITSLDVEKRALHKATEKTHGDSEDDSDEEEAPETETSKESSTEAPAEPFFDIEMPDMNIQDYRKAAMKIPNFIMPLDVPVEELMELFQTQIRDSYVEMQCTKVSKQATKEFLQMRAVLQRWHGMGTRAVFEAWHEVARASRLDANAVKARAERKKLLEKQNRELEEQLARVEARLWVQRSDMYTDAIYFENEQTGETRWEPPQYWAEEQQRQRPNMKMDDVPRLKLPPI
ncbi:uncharacterized protein PITG_15291 [Phytophthora infestans T30-4]|uniref:WW domain-containing protein n=1 Tax=Phytophthora infestans (strain T30-4) TaxID=403677 RepID=D0NQC8_PHYIT|nr:uncharacterized protein PITG_15291 [Phytophthora infestans T30-4]EEY62860.1 conserved hypothetical protein [Phytophthora infestans T30-4]|eukprot:XP_002898735.1 conserved hypothetical protein [Phytophthora infestans T30-4]